MADPLPAWPRLCTLALALLACAALPVAWSGCAPEESYEDPAGDDDSAAVDDEDPDEDDQPDPLACAGGTLPATFTFSGDFEGDFAGEHAFDSFECTDQNGDSWLLRYTNADGWQFRISAGPLVAGETLTSGIDITLQNNGLGASASFSGRTSLGHSASLEVEQYVSDACIPCTIDEHCGEGGQCGEDNCCIGKDPVAPCVLLTTDPLSATAAGGGTLSISPQPIPIDCR
ncbi:MAG TPA: hypothetical protein DIU15_04410 [Deltaproteobacteria bacterium]|nr:hypothetical protein [Deltaproteobacteria bacterium]HCP45256.1 hypothetical protein [Deltaproteobacteria bacterium]